MRVESSAAVRSNAGSFPVRRAGSGMLQWIELGCAGELGADLAHAIAEADHVVEAPITELAQVLGAAPGEVDAALAHHPHRVGMQGLRMAAGAGCAHRSAGQLLAERLGDLRAGAVAGAQEQHVRERGAALARGRRQAGVQRRAGARKQFAAAGQIDRVVRVTAVGGAAAHRDEATVAKLAQVIRDKVLAPARQLAELAHSPIAAGQLSQQLPPQGMPRQPQEPRRWTVDHPVDNTSISFDAMCLMARSGGDGRAG